MKLRYLAILLFSFQISSIAVAAPLCSAVFSAPIEAFANLNFLNHQLQVVENRISYENNRTVILTPERLHVGAKRDDLMAFFYDKKFVEFSEATHLMADKLIMAKTLQHYLGPKFTAYHPPTMGVKEFMTRKNLVTVDGKVRASKEEIGRALDQEFPKGFILKPTLDWSSSGKSFYKDRTEIINLLAASNNLLVNRTELNSPFQGNRTGRVGSGEKLMIMGMIEGTGLLNTKYGEANEFRAHSLFGKVIKGATETRWYTPQDQAKIEAVDSFVQSLLSTLPKGFSQRMGYSFDVFITPKGDLQLIEVNTNRGERTNWSGFLRTPKTIGAYARHVRDNYNWTIEGTEGWMFYNNLANAKKHVKHDLPEWMKDAADPNKHDYALEGFRMLQKDYLDLALAHANDKTKLQSPDFVDLVQFAQEYSSRLSKVKRIGDPAWVEFKAFADSLESH